MVFKIKEIEKDRFIVDIFVANKKDYENGNTDRLKTINAVGTKRNIKKFLREQYDLKRIVEVL